MNSALGTVIYRHGWDEKEPTETEKWMARKKESEVSVVVLDAKYQVVSRKSDQLSKMLFINWVWLGLRNSHCI